MEMIEEIYLDSLGYNEQILAAAWRITASIKNTGNVTYTFVVGASVGAPGGGSKCGLYVNSPYKDLSLTNLTLSPGATQDVSWNFDDSGLNAGANWAVVKVYKGPGTTGCLDGGYASFNVAAAPAAEVTALSAWFDSWYDGGIFFYKVQGTITNRGASTWNFWYHLSIKNPANQTEHTTGWTGNIAPGSSWTNTWNKTDMYSGTYIITLMPFVDSSESQPLIGRTITKTLP